MKQKRNILFIVSNEFESLFEDSKFLCTFNSSFIINRQNDYATMINHLDVLEKLGKIELQTSILNKEKSELCKNTLADFELIPEFYKWYCDAYPSENVTSRKQITSHRRLFVFQMLLLYSPESLQAKKRMPPGLREKLSSVYTEIKPCVISNDISVVVSDYKFYQDFKDQVQLIYGELMKRWVIHLKDQAENN